MNPRHEPVYEFGAFRLEVAEHRVLRDGRPVALTPKLFDLLRVLVENAGHLVEKETLLREVWPETFVEEASLNRGVSVLRKALGEDPPRQRYIETVPKRGYRFVADVRRGVSAEPADVAPPRDVAATVPPGGSAAQGSPRMRAVLAASAAVLLVAVIAWAIFAGRPAESAAGEPVVAVHRQLTFTGKELTPTISPDGTRFAYVSSESPERRVMVQSLADGRSIAVFRAPEAGQPRWSPDGKELLFWARGEGRDGVYITPAAGGEAVRIAAGAFVACWSPDASAVLVADFINHKILFIDRSSHVLRSIDVQGTRGWISDLDWSASAGRLLVVAGDAQGRAAIWSIHPDGTKQSKLVVSDEAITAARWGPQADTIYYFRRVEQTVSLFKANVGAGDGPSASGPPLISGIESDGSFAMSSDGRRIVYARAPYSANLWRVDVPATAGAAPHVRALTTGTSVAERPRVSPDGTSIAFNMGVESHANIYTVPAGGGAPRQVTQLNALSLGAVWSADGQAIAFASTAGGRRRLWIVDLDDSKLRPVSSGEMSESFDLAWSPGRRPLYQQAGNRNVYVVDPDSGEEHLLIADSTVGWAGSPVYAPDGKSVALFWTRAGRAGLWTLDAETARENELYGTASPSEIVPVPIAWSSDGTAVMGLAGKRATNRGVTAPTGETLTEATILRVPTRGGPPSLVVRLPFEEVGGVAISPDGRWIVCSVYESRSDVWVVENFDAMQSLPHSGASK
jgi:Tol biopolymer transport system component/DNA-binding winged helix-turn-helix (wHTH) protein